MAMVALEAVHLYVSALWYRSVTGNGRMDNTPAHLHPGVWVHYKKEASDFRVIYNK